MFFFWLPCFRPKSFGFFFIRLLMFSCHLIPVVDKKNSLFWNVLFCLYCFTLCRYLFNLLSFASTFCFISSSCTVIFSRIAFPFLFQHIPPSFFCFIILACFRRYLSAFPVEFSILILTFSSCFLRESQSSHKLISSLHRLVHLTRLHNSLTCKVVLDLSYSFLS